MAAYASLVNLLNILDQIQDHPRLSLTLQQNQIQLLQQNLHFLLDFVESGPLHRGVEEEEVEILEREIASAAYAAEDVIETHVVDQIQAAAEGSVLLLDLHMVIQDMDYVKEKVVAFKDEIKDLKTTYYPSSASTSSETPLSTTRKSTMVGFDDELYQMMDALTGRQSALQIIPIVGMGGIGKTTLAKNVYERLLKSKHFDICAWATISQEYNTNHIFSSLLSRETESSLEPEDQQLAIELHQMLMNRRYLIVLDDMWSIDVWDKIKFFFPDNNNGSRVVVTTRLSNMATHFVTSLLQMQLLNEDSSWKLFCEKAFPDEGCCPSELVEIGMRIAKKCKGLPLLIIVIGALLRNSSRTPEYWEDISNDINSVSNTGDQEEIKNLDILRLSYRHLPAHLKPCFLYLGVFPEDHVISVSRLIKLWVAEGFVKSNKTQSLEAVAWDYVKDLIDRNLLISRSSKWNGKTKECQMHDLLRDLCLKLAKKESFLCVIRAGYIQQGVADKARRIVFQQGTSSSVEETSPDFDGLESALPLTRSLVSEEHDWFSLSIKIIFKLLRVLNTPYSSYYMNDTFKQVNLRYINSLYEGSRTRGGLVLSSISLLWNLQTLIIGNVWQSVIAPPEIWEMRQLRHVNINMLRLPDPPPLSSNQLPADELVLPNLQSLKRAFNLRLSEEVYKRILHVKKLTVEYNDLSGNLSFDFGRLHELELLKCWFKEKPNVDDLLQSLTFPSPLQELTLSGCHLRWEDLSMIGSLPHLEVLKLQENSVTGTEWSLAEGEFLGLKFLEISNCGDLMNWNIINSDDYNYSSSSFPVLEELVLRGLKNLNEIPSCIGEIPTLGFIHLSLCSESAAISAMEILQSLGNDGLQVEIGFWEKKKLRSFKEKVQHMDCFTSTNLHLRSLLT